MRTKLILLMLLFTGLVNITGAQGDMITIDLDDILERIAAEFDVAVDCLEQTNNLDNFRSVGVLSVDPTCPAYDGNLVLGGGQGGGINEYTVQSGDRLADIAEEVGSTVACLQTANEIDDPNLIFPGQTLAITATCEPPGAEPEATVETTDDADTGTVGTLTGSGECLGDRNGGRVAESGFYTIQRGDILDFIACDFDVSIVCIVDGNTSLQDPLNRILRTGQEIRIPATDCPPWDGPFNSGILNGE